MRLDHLLSKELYFCVPAVVGVCVVDVAECATATKELFAGWRHTLGSWLRRLDGGAAGSSGVVLRGVVVGGYTVA